MSPEDQLSAFLGETPRHGRANLFALEVMKRVERQVFLERIMFAAGAAAMLGLVLWACAPALDVAVAMIAPGFAPVAALLTFVAAILVGGGPSVWRRLSFPGG